MLHRLCTSHQKWKSWNFIVGKSKWSFFKEKCNYSFFTNSKKYTPGIRGDLGIGVNLYFHWIFVFYQNLNQKKRLNEHDGQKMISHMIMMKPKNETSFKFKCPRTKLMKCRIFMNFRIIQVYQNLMMIKLSSTIDDPKLYATILCEIFIF